MDPKSVEHLTEHQVPWNPPPPPLRWQYKFVTGKNVALWQDEAMFNSLGGEGWELCAHVNGVFIFKRPL